MSLFKKIFKKENTLPEGIKVSFNHAVVQKHISNKNIDINNLVRRTILEDKKIALGINLNTTKIECIPTKGNKLIIHGSMGSGKEDLIKSIITQIIAHQEDSITIILDPYKGASHYYFMENERDSFNTYILNSKELSDFTQIIKNIKKYSKQIPINLVIDNFDKYDLSFKKIFHKEISSNKIDNLNTILGVSYLNIQDYNAENIKKFNILCNKLNETKNTQEFFQKPFDELFKEKFINMFNRDFINSVFLNQKGFLATFFFNERFLSQIIRHKNKNNSLINKKFKNKIEISQETFFKEYEKIFNKNNFLEALKKD